MHTKSLQSMSPAVVVQADCDCAIAQVMLRLAADDVIVRRSFELDSACGSLAYNMCPHDGQVPCECRLAVLILHDAHGRIATLVAHGNGRLTELCLVDSTGFHPDPDFERQIRSALASLDAATSDEPDFQAPLAA